LFTFWSEKIFTPRRKRHISSPVRPALPFFSSMDKLPHIQSRIAQMQYTVTYKTCRPCTHLGTIDDMIYTTLPYFILDDPKAKLLQQRFHHISLPDIIKLQSSHFTDNDCIINKSVRVRVTYKCSSCQPLHRHYSYQSDELFAYLVFERDVRTPQLPLFQFTETITLEGLGTFQLRLIVVATDKNSHSFHSYVKCNSSSSSSIWKSNLTTDVPLQINIQAYTIDEFTNFTEPNVRLQELIHLLYFERI
jgi:hypothetical protein